MRKNRNNSGSNEISILAVDDDPTMTLTLQAYFQSSGYRMDVENDPLLAIERVRNGAYDILMLDFLMTPICGDKVVEEIRKFNQDIYIILLTGHKNMVPPIRTIRELAIQGYFEKSNRFDQLELLVESCVKSIRQMKAIRQYETGLHQMITLMPNIYHLQEREKILNQIVVTACEVLKCKRSFLALAGDEKAEKIVKGYEYAFCGSCDENEIAQMISRLDVRVRAEDIYESDAYLVVPLTGPDGKKLGYLGAQVPRAIQEQDRQLLKMLGRQSAIAIDNIRLHMALTNKHQELENANEMLRKNYMDMISALRSTVDARDIYTRNHSDRVSWYAVLLSEALGNTKAYSERIRIAGLFHDIGKIAIPDDVLMKAGSLTEEEYEVIKGHPVKGEQILGAVSQLFDILPAVRYHHERFDGSGYPDGLRGEEIPESARIIAVADAFDAMVSNRRYRHSMSLERAISELEAGRDTQFDGKMVDAFLPLLDHFDEIQEEMKGVNINE